MEKAKLKEAIECIVNNGSFGESVTLVDVVPSELKGEDHFASEVVFAKVIIKNGIEDKSVSIVVKNQTDDLSTREYMKTHIQFYNELIMYRDILPYLDKKSAIKTMFPKLFHGVATLGKNFQDDIMVVEDLQTSGFKLTKNRLFLDIDHCKLALSKLGKFHALSYLAKRDDLDQFNSKVKQLKEVRMGSDDEGADTFLSVYIERSILPLNLEGEHKSSLEMLREKTKKPSELLMKLVQPDREPLAVLCHGDFCRNNMLFSYSENGRPKDVRFFDLATARYASPAIDLSFFMLMNTSTKLRSTHWHNLLATYHSALVSAAPECPVISLDELHQELREKALYGYILCTFFIPMMVDKETHTEENKFSEMTPEEKEVRSWSIGGEEATKYTSDIVRDLIKFECI